MGTRLVELRDLSIPWLGPADLRAWHRRGWEPGGWIWGGKVPPVDKSAGCRNCCSI